MNRKNEIPDEDELEDGENVNENVDDEGDEVNEEIDEEEEPTEEEQVVAAVEERARRMGWFPESDWNEQRAARTGFKKPNPFLTAEEFLDRVENETPVLRERNRFLDNEVARLTEEGKTRQDGLQSKVDDLNRLMKDMYRHNKTIGKRAYEKGRTEAMAAKREAIEAADPVAVEVADQQLREINAELENLDSIEETIETPETETTEKPAESTAPQMDPQTKAWLAENSWYNTDGILRAIMLESHNKLIGENVGVPQHELLEQAKQVVVEKYPERFGINPNRDAPASTLSPKTRRRTGKTFADLPREDQAAFRRMAEWMKDQGEEFTQKEFLDDYYRQ